MMKILEINKKRSSVKIKVEDEDDLWLLRSIIVKDDIVFAKTTRDVKVEGSQGKKRIPLYLGIVVKNVEFQAFTGRLRIRGVIIEGPEEYGLKGSHHTITVDVGSEVEILKKEWSKFFIKKLLKGTRKRYKLILMALDYDEVSIAALYDQGIRYLINKEFPSLGKEGGVSSLSEIIIDNILPLIKEIVNQYKTDLLVIGSPAFLKDEIATKLKKELPGVKIYTDSVSVGGKAGISELLRRDLIRKIIRDLSSVKAENVIEKFMYNLVKSPSRIAYSIDHVEKAAEYGAVDTLLVLDELLYNTQPEIRERLEKILDMVDEKGGNIMIVGKESPAGMKLKGLGGIIALLRFNLNIE